MTGAPTLTTELAIADCLPLPPPLPATAMLAPAPVRRRRTTALSPGARIGVWRIERELGRGGMATVYAVVHTRFGKRAALKLAHAGILGPQFTAETFLREARIANMVNHAGVTDVFATGSYAGRPYLVMERLQGQSVGAMLQDRELSHEAAIDLLSELCDVLGAAHAAGVTHGDLKADNVFVLDEPAAGGRHTKLLDWGIARIAGEEDPLRGMIAGTLTYVAPEQIRGDEIGPAADVYALGVLAYRLLLGAPPFAATSDLELLHKHLREEPPRPRTQWATIPAELETMMVAMLDKQPSVRPSVAQVAEALRAARRRLRPDQRPWRTPPAALPADVMGRPMIGRLPGPTQRVAGAALGIALLAASLYQFIV